MNDNISFLTDESEKEYIELIKENAEELFTMEEKIINVYPQLENLEVTPSVEEQVFNHDNSYGYDEVKVKAIEDENLVPENIKRGVNILGVEGTMVGGKYAPRYLYNPISFRSYSGTELDHETSMLDTTNFTDMSYMFYYCSNLTSLNLSGFNTSNVKNMNNMFAYCQALTELDLSNFDTSNVTNMSRMFERLSYNARKTTTLNLSNFDISNVKDISSMFADCSYITELDLSSFKTNKITMMSNMFKFCSKLTRIDMRNLDTSNVTYMDQMFFSCSALKYLDIRNFTFDKVTNFSNMFTSVPNDCLIIVKGQTEKDWVLARKSSFTNVKTIEEYENGI